jgi:hypothetical protein
MLRKTTPTKTKYKDLFPSDGAFRRGGSLGETSSLLEEGRQSGWVASSSLRDAPPSVSWRKALMYTAAATAATADTFDTRQECSSWLPGNVQTKSRHHLCRPETWMRQRGNGQLWFRRRSRPCRRRRTRRRPSPAASPVPCQPAGGLS